MGLLILDEETAVSTGAFHPPASELLFTHSPHRILSHASSLLALRFNPSSAHHLGPSVGGYFSK
jgi:hypothetical protein